jgi:hypothetical protein
MLPSQDHAADGSDDIGQIERRRVHAELRARLFGAEPEPVRIDRFELRRRLGAGAMGIVYAAYDPKLQREVALKLLNGVSPHQSHPFFHEARALASLSHPNVLPVYEAGVHGAVPYLVSELVTGGTLRDWLAGAGRPRRWEDIVRALLGVGEGVLAAHLRGLVHRDIKPENILVGADGRPRVADFSLAQAPGQATAASGELAGTLRYMAPEQLRGERADPLSDQFSFCVVAFEALYGAFPFDDAGPAPMLRAIEAGHVRPVPPKHPAAAALPLLRRGLSASPTARYPALAELLARLEALLRRRRRATLGLRGLAVALVAGAAGGAWALSHRSIAREFDTTAERDLYERASALTQAQRYADCDTLLRTRPASEPLARLRVACAQASGDPARLEAACDDWHAHVRAEPPAECQDPTRKARALFAKRRYEECIAVLGPTPYTGPGMLAMSNCAAALHSIDGYFRMCNYSRKANPAAPPCKRLTSLGPRPGPP